MKWLSHPWSGSWGVTLVVEQNNELWLKNHQSHSTGFVSLFEANATSLQTPRHGQGSGYGLGWDRGRGRNRGCGRHNSSYRSGIESKKNNSNHHKWNNLEAQPEKRIKPQSKHAHENKCYRCGMKGHW